MSSDSVVVRLRWEAHSWGSVLSCSFPSHNMCLPRNCGRKCHDSGTAKSSVLHKCPADSDLEL